jgi:hypothetical protein
VFATWTPLNKEISAFSKIRYNWTKKFFNLPHEKVNKLAVLSLQYQILPLIKLIAFVMQLVNITAEGKVSVT